MTEEHKIKIPPYEELDDYEKELCSSTDPIDHTALLIRLALKNVNVDPDKDDWWVSRQDIKSGNPNLVTEGQKTYVRPRVTLVNTDELRGRVYTSVDWGVGESHSVEQVCMNFGMFHSNNLEALITKACAEINVNPDNYRSRAIRAFEKWSMEHQHVLPHLTEEKMITWFLVAIKQLVHSEELGRIRTTHGKEPKKIVTVGEKRRVKVQASDKELAEEARQWDEGELKPTDPGWEDVGARALPEGTTYREAFRTKNLTSGPGDLCDRCGTETELVKHEDLPDRLKDHTNGEEFLWCSKCVVLSLRRGNEFISPMEVKRAPTQGGNDD